MIERLEQLCIEGSAHDFVTTDDDLAACGMRILEQIIKEVELRASWSNKDNRSDDGVGAAKEPVTPEETSHVLSRMRYIVCPEGISQETCARFCVFSPLYLET